MGTNNVTVSLILRYALERIPDPFRVFLYPHIAQYVRIAQEGLRNHSWASHTDPNTGGTVGHARTLQTMLLPLFFVTPRLFPASNAHREWQVE